MATYNPAGGTTYTLNSSISSTQTSFILSSFLEPFTGTPYTMALLNTDIVYFTIAPKTTQSEFVSGTTLTQNADGTCTVGGVTRGLAKKYPFTTDSAFKLPHSGQTQVIMSDAPQVFVKYASIDNDITIHGLWTFDQNPIGLNPGAVQDSSTTVKGIGKLSVAPVSATNPIFVGDNDPRVPTTAQVGYIPTSGQKDALVGDNTDIAVGSGNTYVTQTGLAHNAEKYFAVVSNSSTAYVATLSPAPTSQTDGMVIYLKMDLANTTSTPTIALNGLTARTIVKKNGTALVANDIGAGMLCTFIYDLSNTRWVLQSPVATAPILFASGQTTYDLSTASGAQTIAHGLGKAPNRVKLTGTLGATSSTLTNVTFGTYDGSTNNCIASNGVAAQDVSSSSFGIYFRPANNATEQSQTGVITFDATNITITWTKLNSPAGTARLLWEAQSNN